MIVYLDTSVVLRHLLGQAEALEADGWQRAYSSEILGLEARRVIDRIRLESALDDDGVARAHEALAHMEQSIHCMFLTRPILRRAALPMPTVVKTLDAIHLASALLFQERTGDSLTFATHDLQQATCARALGFKIIGR
jgi:predicted nucleic acid-binding protein